jgi:hypothetical protein
MLESGGNMQKDMGDPLAGQARAAAGTATGRAQHRLGFLFVTGSAIAWSLGGLFTHAIHVDSWATCSPW